MLPVIAYIRVSTKQQALNGTSLDGQKLQISVYAKRKELHIAKWFKDDSSARNEEEGSERPGCKAACDLALKKGWPILVVDASRFSRTKETYERFINAGGKVYDLSGFGDDEAEMAAKIARAKFDGDKRSRATKKGQDEAKAAGKKFGTPFPMNGAKASAVSRGGDADIRRGELERLRDEAAKAGVTGPKEFADWLNRKGYLTAQGKPWTASNVRGRLRERSQANDVTEPPIPVEPDPAVQGELVAFTPEEFDLLRRLIATGQLDEQVRARWLESMKGLIPRLERDLLVAKSREAIECGKAKRLTIPEEYKNNPDYGSF